MTGTGGALFVQQLKAAGVEFMFINPATGDAPIFDALVDEPGIQLIKGVQEGAVAAMADGYARLSGKPGVVVVANVGPAQRHDPDGQQLQGSHSDRGRGGGVRPGGGGPGGAAGLRLPGIHAGPDHQVALDRAKRARHSRDDAPRPQIRRHAAIGTGVPRHSRK